jgi:methylated-DNA-[protein]-cysteine S-methyltransferase
MPQTTFSTPLGLCGLEWNESVLTRFLLPGFTPQPGLDAALPLWVQALIERVGRHLTGDFQEFTDVPYDFTPHPQFLREVLRATLAVKTGRTATYGEIAQAIGHPPAASRAVGSALGANPWPLLIPCHRIVAANGKMTGYSGPGGIDTKVRLLALEGAQLL